MVKLLRRNRIGSPLKFHGDRDILVYRYASTSDNSRTMIAAALPIQGFLFSTGYAHGIVTSDAPLRDVLALLGYLNTHLCDWWVRRLVDRHVTAQVLAGIPLPSWDEDERAEVAALVTQRLVLGGVTRLPGSRTLRSVASLKSASENELDQKIDSLALEGLGLKASDYKVVLADFTDASGAAPDGRVAK